MGTAVMTMPSTSDRAQLIHRLSRYVDASDLHTLSDAGLVRLAERCGVSHCEGMTTSITPQAVADKQCDLYRRYVLRRYPTATIIVRTRCTGARTAKQSVIMLDAAGEPVNDVLLDGVPFDDHPDWIAYFESIGASVGSRAEVTIRADRPVRIRLELRGASC